MIKVGAVKFNNVKTILVFVCAALLLTYALLAFNAMRAEYSIEEMRERITALEEDSADLRLELSRVSSLDYVLEQSDALSYTDISSVSYLEKASTSPFAAR